MERTESSREGLQKWWSERKQAQIAISDKKKKVGEKPGRKCTLGVSNGLPEFGSFMTCLEKVVAMEDLEDQGLVKWWSEQTAKAPQNS